MGVGGHHSPAPALLCTWQAAWALRADRFFSFFSLCGEGSSGETCRRTHRKGQSCSLNPSLQVHALANMPPPPCPRSVTSRTALQGRSGEASYGSYKTWHTDSKYRPSSSVGIVPASTQRDGLSSLRAANHISPCQAPETEPGRESVVARIFELRSYLPAVPLVPFPLQTWDLHSPRRFATTVWKQYV